MPLDGYSYLTSYGWTGRGTGLRKGAIDKPIAVAQKRTLAGVGKDRDEAFPFWDHLFSAASKAITIKVTNDDEEEEDLPQTQPLDLKRTSTGIISNRRPTDGTPASGSVTPDPNAGPHLSLVAAAKREAVRRGLYSRFFRGPVLGPDTDTSTSAPPTTSSSPAPESTSSKIKNKRKKSGERTETEEERRKRKRLKRERREAKALKKPAQENAAESCSEDSDKEHRKTKEQLSDPGEHPSKASKRKRKRKDLPTEWISGKPCTTESHCTPPGADGSILQHRSVKRKCAK
ncbi:hypothetical protein V8B97DRAFT_1869086 [Scleroderma yunnanense]